MVTNRRMGRPSITVIDVEPTMFRLADHVLSRCRARSRAFGVSTGLCPGVLSLGRPSTGGADHSDRGRHRAPSTFTGAQYIQWAQAYSNGSRRRAPRLPSSDQPVDGRPLPLNSESLFCARRYPCGGCAFCRVLSGVQQQPAATPSRRVCEMRVGPVACDQEGSSGEPPNDCDGRCDAAEDERGIDCRVDTFTQPPPAGVRRARRCGHEVGEPEKKWGEPEKWGKAEWLFRAWGGVLRGRR